MKKIVVSALFLILSAAGYPARAGTPVTLNMIGGLQNLQMMFLMSSDDGSDMEIDGGEGHALSFKKVSQNGDTTIYKEMTGKCQISLQQFEKNFAGKNDNEDNIDNLDLRLTVVRLIGGNACTLNFESEHEAVSIVGFYL